MTLWKKLLFVGLVVGGILFYEKQVKELEQPIKNLKYVSNQIQEKPKKYP